MIPYPVEVTSEIMNCFDCNMKLRQNTNSYMRYVGDVGEELWIYSKIRELLSSEEDKTYCDSELEKVRNKISTMQKQIQDNFNSEIAERMKELCLTVYGGENFDDKHLNEFIQRVQVLCSQ